jgi:hypothetical protein
LLAELSLARSNFYCGKQTGRIGLVLSQIARILRLTR